MSSCPPPNDALAELSHVLGVDNVRTLVRTFLREFPASFEELRRGDHKVRHRLAHSMKSSSRLVGAIELSRHMAELEARFAKGESEILTAADAAQITTRYEAIAPQLREFAGV